MITIKRFSYNAFQVNTYVLSDESGECIIIDPGMESSEEENEITAYIESLAEQRGRNMEVARRFVTEAHNLTASEALEQNLIDFIAPTLGAVLDSLQGRTALVAGEEVTIETGGCTLRAVGLVRRRRRRAQAHVAPERREERETRETRREKNGKDERRIHKKIQDLDGS